MPVLRAIEIVENPKDRIFSGIHFPSEHFLPGYSHVLLDIPIHVFQPKITASVHSLEASVRGLPSLQKAYHRVLCPIDRSVVPVPCDGNESNDTTKELSFKATLSRGWLQSQLPYELLPSAEDQESLEFPVPSGETVTPLMNAPTLEEIIVEISSAKLYAQWTTASPEETVIPSGTIVHAHGSLFQYPDQTRILSCAPFAHGQFDPQRTKLVLVQAPAKNRNDNNNNTVPDIEEDIASASLLLHVLDRPLSKELLLPAEETTHLELERVLLADIETLMTFEIVSGSLVRTCYQSPIQSCRFECI